MMNRIFFLILIFIGTNCYAVGNPQYLEDNLRGLQQALNSTNFVQKYRSQTDSIFDTSSSVVKNISNGNYDQANLVSAQELARIKYEIAKNLREMDRSQWASYMANFNSISPIKLNVDEVTRLAEKLLN